MRLGDLRAVGGEPGRPRVAVDDCGYGASRCTEQLAGDTRAMVALAGDWARSQGATRVAVVGPSMGGARALGVGQAAGADVVVDLSGAHALGGCAGCRGRRARDDGATARHLGRR